MAPTAPGLLGTTGHKKADVAEYREWHSITSAYSLMGLLRRQATL